MAQLNYSETVLISIKPKYASRILNGEKTIEFRKTAFSKNVRYMVVYSSRPVQKVVCIVKVGEIVKNAPSVLWERYGKDGRIDRKDFDEYFKGKAIGYAIKIDNVERLSVPIDIDKVKHGITPPQNYMYLNTYRDVPVGNHLNSH